ncbi:hypothetical protein NLJ89_g3840 [Agrocybe chaxingu]|uniref:HMA domain-containing protein n=1 Tax=Agrocybe chaxingu TaxID=84603 RepID=A0A9W8MX20_9AGAR|nr:hypothetical protein NLJ89_g3840 [Agrocybe chaxingu]
MEQSLNSRSYYATDDANMVGRGPNNFYGLGGIDIASDDYGGHAISKSADVEEDDCHTESCASKGHPSTLNPGNKGGDSEDECGCCAGKGEPVERQDGAKELESVCGDSCCGGKENVEDDISEGCKDGCCGELKRVSEQDAACEKACCTKVVEIASKECDEGSLDACGCCTSEEEDGSCSAPFETQENDIEEGDSACPCCIQVLINEPALRAKPKPSHSHLDEVVESARSRLESSTRILRACCKILEDYCVGRSCCFVAPPTHPKKLSTSPVKPTSLTKDQSRGPNVTSISELPKDVAGREKLRLEVRGMDCPDCTPKVLRALSHLPSVHSSSIDYFSGMAELYHDPESISPSAIASYVARATGFGVRPLTDLANGESAIVTFPLSFTVKPPPEAFAGLDAVPGLDPRVVDVSFPVSPDNPQRPRDIFANFKPYGAELAPNGSRGERDNALRDFINVGLRTLASAILSIPILVLAWAELPPRPVLHGAISVALTTGIQLLGYSILSSAFRSILYLRQVDLSVLVAVSTLTAYLFSVIAYAFEVAGQPFSAPFFETTALLVTLILLGRTVAAATRQSTRSALRELERLQPNDVLLLSGESNSTTVTLDSRLLFYGDVIRIPPDTRIATDGIVIAGSSDVDESSITGESVAVPKETGNRVIAGTLNLNGTLDIQVTRLIHENSLSRITMLVKHAQMSRARSPVQDLADRLSAWILPIATFAAFTAFVVWVLVGIYVLHLSKTAASVDALTYMIAVFVVSCPCAIGLAVPMVISRSIRIALKEGVLFRSPTVLQLANNVDTLVFDKTGTLTQGSFSVERVEILVKGAEPLIMALIKDNKHPISQGVYRYLTSQCPSTGGKELLEKGGVVSDIVSLPGKGIKATIQGFPLLGGSPSFTGACNHPISIELQTSGLSLFSVTLAGRPLVIFGLIDTPRPEAQILLDELKKRGKKVVVMSGDTPSSVHRLAETLGLPPTDVFSGCTPEDKDTSIAALKVKGSRVCFVGDGTNDAPALSRADVSLAVASGSEVALGAAGAVLLGSDLSRGVLTLLDIARDAKRHCLLALGWCVVYNVFAILLASGAFVKVRIEPRWAGVGEVVSVLPVIGVAFLLDAKWGWGKKRT